MSVLYRRLGVLMGATGVLHTLLVAVLFTGPPRAIWQAGVWNSIAHDHGRAAFLWSVCSGGLMVLLGYLMHWVLQQQPLPRGLGAGLAALALAGAIVMPVSGFWLVLILAGLILRGPYTAPAVLRRPAVS